MSNDALTGVAQALASMVAQNTNIELPEVTTVGDSRRFVAQLPHVGWVRVTVEEVDSWSDGRPYVTRDNDAPEPVYDSGRTVTADASLLLALDVLTSAMQKAARALDAVAHELARMRAE